MFSVKGGMQFVHEQQQYTCWYLTHFSPMLYFYTTWKRLKTKDFITFSGGIEMENWAKMG